MCQKIYACLILWSDSNSGPDLGSLISLIKSLWKCFHIHGTVKPEGQLHVAWICWNCSECEMKAVLYVELHICTLTTSMKPIFSLLGNKSLSLQSVWLLHYTDNQITSTMRINVIGFTIIRVKYTVIYNERNTKLLEKIIRYCLC